MKYFVVSFVVLAFLAGQVDAATFSVITTNEAGSGSLRQAILDANANPGADTINFAITNALRTIIPTNALPVLTEAVIIDATTQPGYSNAPIVELNGQSAGAGTHGLRLWAGNCVVRGLAINRFNGNGMEIANNGNNLIEGCWIGVGLDGITDRGNTANGIFITNAPNNHLGGTSALQRNVISGNTLQGIQVAGTNSYGTVIEGNYLGLSALGNNSVGNSQNGVFLLNSPSNIIGGILNGTRNLISGNGVSGVRIEGSNAFANVVSGNFIGLDVSGTTNRGNLQNGVGLFNSPSNVVGGVIVEARNLLSGNGNAGVRLDGALTRGNHVFGNYFGTDVTGTLARGNTFEGINLLNNASGNKLGGVNPGEANLIMNNSGDGIWLQSGTNNAARGNSICGNVGLGIDLGISGVTTNDVNDADTGANQLQNFPILTTATNTAGGLSIFGNLNSRSSTTFILDFYSNVARDSATNGEGQVWLGSAQVTTDASGNVSFSAFLTSTAFGRYISSTATDPLENTSEFSSSIAAASTIPPMTFTVVNTNDSGVGSLRQAILDATAFVSAGPDTIGFNIPGTGPQSIAPRSELPPLYDAAIIDGFTQPGASANTLSNGNDAVWKIVLLGSNAGTGAEGLRLESSGSFVRGVAIILFNGNGIEIVSNGNNTVEGCLIGLGLDASDQGNAGSGIAINSSPSNQIGGTSPAKRNIISGNNSYGVAFTGVGSTNNFIQGNFIGTQPQANSLDGVNLNNASFNLVGGSTVGAGNVISGNNSDGIELVGGTNNVIFGNLIGTDVSGALSVPNNASGINLSSTSRSHKIGGTNALEANRIWFNIGSGIVIAAGTAGTNNAIRGNSLFSNGGLGIDLGANGKTLNDAGDADTGANNLQNYPVLSSATINPEMIAIQGALNSRPNTLYELDFFANSVLDPSTNGEGQVYLGSTTLTTDGSGNQTFNLTLPGTISMRFFSATATDPFGNTSEFAACIRAASTVPPLTFTVMNTNDSGPGSFRQALLNNNASATATNNLIAFNIPGAGPHLIQLASAMPILTETVTIDGYTQPGASANTLSEGDNAVLKIRIDGQSAGSEIVRLQNSNSIVRGLSLTRTTSAAALIQMFGGGGHRIEGNFIGLDTDGVTTFGASGSGVEIYTSTGNQIGGTAPASRNLIAGNSASEVMLRNGSSNNVVLGNYIGTDRTGTLDRGISTGIQLYQCRSNLIGGAASGARNLISGENNYGIYFTSSVSNNLVQGNFIGTDFTGGAALANSVGVYVNSYGSTASGNVIGGTNSGEGNVIAFNGGPGVELSSGTNYAVRGNSIFNNGALGIELQPHGVTPNDPGDADGGENQQQNFPILTNATATATSILVEGTLNSRANSTFFVDFFSSPQGDISGNGQGQKYLGSATVATDAGGNVSFGVTISTVALGRYITATATDTNGNTSEFSAFLAAASTILPVTLTVVNTNDSGAGSLRQAILDSNNTGSGAPNTIVFNIPGAGPHILTPVSLLPFVIEPVLIDGYSQPGARANTSSNAFNAVLKIRLDGAGLTDGLRLTGRSSTVRGLAFTRWAYGVTISGSSNAVEGCVGGVDEAGIIRSNRFTAVNLVSGEGHVIGGVTPATRNVFSNNRFYGISIGGASNCWVCGNLIGPDFSGINATPGQPDGVYVQSTGNLIGGSMPGARNVLSGNNNSGVHVYLGQANRVEGNFIGVNAYGTAALANGGAGVYLQNAPLNTIGGANPGARNVISGNADEGVDAPFGAFSNRVIGNFIGTDASGTNAIGNGGIGVSVAAGGVVGGAAPGEGNRIAHNFYGVQTGTNCPVRRNEIFNNTSTGIGIGVQINDLGDLDSWQNFPVLTSATINATTVRIQGSLNSRPNRTCALDFFASNRPDPSGYGEGQQVIGSTNVATDGSGNVNFDVTFSATAVGRYMTATATSASPEDNTSQFSKVLHAGSSISPMTFTVVNTNNSGPGSLRQALLNTENFIAGGNHIIAFNIPGTNFYSIMPFSPLPAVTEPFTLDAFTQLGARAATSTNGDNAVRKIRLDGRFAGASANGLLLTNSGNIVRGLEILYFAGDGIELAAGTNTIEGCYIHTNAQHGVHINNCAANLIGGSTPASRNILSGNAGRGIKISGEGAMANLVYGNYIGSQLDGAYGLPNAVGVEMDNAPANLIGGSPASRNIIGGNTGVGVSILGSGAVNNLVQGNHIGATPFASNLGNGGGVSISGGASKNIIGEPRGSGAALARGKAPAAAVYEITGLMNLIAYNQFAGVEVSSGMNNTIRANRIFENSGLGIDLAPNGVNQNDLTDNDPGANEKQNFPLIQSALITASNLVIQATLNSRPSTSYQIDFYLNVLCDPLLHGEGEYWIGMVYVTTDLSGNALFNASIAGAGLGTFVTCTATDPVGNTSEFSPCTQATSELPPQTFLVTTDADGGAGSLRAAIENANATPTSGSHQINFNIPGFGLHVIDLVTPFDAIVVPVNINGLTQPGSTPQHPKIHVRGNRLSGKQNGLHVKKGSSSVAGMQLSGFVGDGILIECPTMNVENCTLGGGEPGAVIVENGVTVLPPCNQIKILGCVFSNLGRNAVNAPDSGGGNILFSGNNFVQVSGQSFYRTGPGGPPAPIFQSTLPMGNDFTLTGTVFGMANEFVVVEIYSLENDNPLVGTPLTSMNVQIGPNGSGIFSIQRPVPPGTFAVMAFVTRNSNNTSPSSVPFYLRQTDYTNPVVVVPPVTGNSTSAANRLQAGTAADPISTFTGELYDSLPPDLDLGGPMPLRFQRFYGSLLAADGAIASSLGENWLHNFDLSLSNKVSSVDVVLYPGMSLTFTNLGGGNYALLNRADLRFQMGFTNAHFVVADPRSQRLFTFSNAGRLLQVEDGRGNTHTLSYVGPNLVSVSDGLGRTLSLQYSPIGSLTNVTDGTRSVAFRQSSGLLTSASTPLGFTTTYKYAVTNLFTTYPYPSLLQSATRPETNTPFSQFWTSIGQVSAQNSASAAWSPRYIGNITQVRDPSGFAVLHDHDTNGLLKAWTDEAGRTITLGYNTNGQRTSVTDRLGNTTRLAYDAPSGKVSSLTNADGTVTTLTYTNRVASGVTFHDVSRVTYPDSSTETFSYDTNGNVTAHTDRAGLLSQFTYNSRGQMIEANNPAGGVISRTYNPNGTLATSRNSETGFTLYSYDAFSRLTNITHPDSSQLQFVYDADGRLTSATDERNSTTQFAYDKNGRLIRGTDAQGKTNQFFYDSVDRLVQTIDRLGRSSSIAYEPRGLVSIVADRNNFRTTLAYDRRQRLVSSKDPENRITQFGYDEEGMLISVTNANQEISRLTRDALGYVIGATNPLGHVTSFNLDTMRRLTNLVDGLGRSYSYRYDARGLLINATHPSLGSASFERNALGELSRITDLNGRQWNFNYSPMGRLQSIRDPLSRQTAYTYDTRGRRQRLAFADGVSATNTFDAASNLIRRQFSDGADLQFGYDSLNRLINASGASFAYDAEGRLTNDTAAGILFGARYDGDGRLTNVTYNIGLLSVRYTYDDSGRLASASDSLTGTLLIFLYDAAGRLRTINRPNNINTAYTYDAAGRLTRILDGTFPSNIIDISYTIDAANQVNSADFTAPLDPSEFAGTNVNNFTYDAAHQISNAGFNYDARGRLRASPGNNFTFDGASRLTAINGVTLGYDGLGDLVTRTESGITTRFFHHRALSMSPIVAERNESNGQVLRYYVWSPDGRLLYMIDPGNGNAVSHFHFDRVGSTLALTSAAGTVTDAYAWTPYGELLARTGTNQQPFTFIGRHGVRSEPAGNLFHMRARYYDPASARFLSPDPIWPQLTLTLELNPYQYAVEQPLRYIDPNGLISDEEDDFIVGTALYGLATGNWSRSGRPAWEETPQEKRDRERVHFQADQAAWEQQQTQTRPPVPVFTLPTASIFDSLPDDPIFGTGSPLVTADAGQITRVSYLDLVGDAPAPASGSKARTLVNQAVQAASPVARPRDLVQTGRNRPSICSFESISSALESAIPATGSGRSSMARVILDSANDEPLE